MEQALELTQENLLEGPLLLLFEFLQSFGHEGFF